MGGEYFNLDDVMAETVIEPMPGMEKKFSMMKAPATRKATGQNPPVETQRPKDTSHTGKKAGRTP